ncbi:MAG: PilZ domain-containing protein [Acidobacteriaceae bacterium]
MKNFSISGMLFVADQPIQRGTSIEMRFTLPVELKDRCPADVCCRGTVVRSEQNAKPGSPIYIAAKILHSHLLRHKEIA